MNKIWFLEPLETGVFQNDMQYSIILQLEYDVLEYVVIERLARSGREHKVESCFDNISEFVGALTRSSHMPHLLP